MSTYAASAEVEPAASTDLCASAADDLFQRHRRRIFAYCVQQLRSVDDAEDAVQQTYLNALRGLRRGIDPRFEAAWLLAIARNVCLERHRSANRRRRYETSADPEALSTFAGASRAGWDELIDLPHALASIDRRHSEVLVLREWRGLSYSEIAARLGISEPAVESLLVRARRALVRVLTDRQRLRRALNLGSLLGPLRSLLPAGAEKLAVVIACSGAAALAEPSLPPAAWLPARPTADTPRLERTLRPATTDASPARRAAARSEAARREAPPVRASRSAPAPPPRLAGTRRPIAGAAAPADSAPTHESESATAVVVSRAPVVALPSGPASDEPARLAVDDRSAAEQSPARRAPTASGELAAVVSVDASALEAQATIDADVASASGSIGEGGVEAEAALDAGPVSAGATASAGVEKAASVATNVAVAPDAAASAGVQMPTAPGGPPQLDAIASLGG